MLWAALPLRTLQDGDTAPPRPRVRVMYHFHWVFTAPAICLIAHWESGFSVNTALPSRALRLNPTLDVDVPVSGHFCLMWQNSVKPSHRVYNCLTPMNCQLNYKIVHKLIHIENVEGNFLVGRRSKNQGRVQLPSYENRITLFLNAKLSITDFPNPPTGRNLWLSCIIWALKEPTL